MVTKQQFEMSSINKPCSTLPENGRVVAFVVGLENYQKRGVGELPMVDFARKDAESFVNVLSDIYAGREFEPIALMDNDATQGNINYELKQVIGSLEEDDLFIFYYAGHGFHGAGGNRITAWDSHAHNIEGTTLLLREVLFDRLSSSQCRRALAFVDACASEFAEVVPSRDVITSLDERELQQFLSSAEYLALFMSCSPGEKSFPSDKLNHGIWTHFLLKALRGEAEDALGPQRYLTDVGLRDFLRKEVPRYVTREMTVRAQQTPRAMITASNTFVIRDVPSPRATIAEAGDLRHIRVAPNKEYIEGTEQGSIRTIPGFSKSRGHFVPDSVNDATDTFVKGLLTERINDEIQELYEAVKANFGLRRRDIQRENGDGAGNIDTEFFRFSIEARQASNDPAAYTILRQLELRTNADEHRDEFDETFGRMFERIVVKVDPNQLSYDELVDKLEDIEEALGGEVKDEENAERVTYSAPDGTTIRFNVRSGRISLAVGRKQLLSSLLERVRQYRFGLDGPSVLLLA